MVAHSSFQEPSTKVADTRLTQFELELNDPVCSRVDKQGGTLIVCIGLHRLFLFKKQSNDADIKFQFIFVGDGTAARGEHEDSRKSVDTVRTENLNLVECPSRREQHPTNLPLLPACRPAGVSVMQPIVNSQHRTHVGYLQTDLLLVCNDSRLQDQERALDDRPPDIFHSDLLRLKSLYKF